MSSQICNSQELLSTYQTIFFNDEHSHFVLSRAQHNTNMTSSSNKDYHKTSNISRTLVGNEIVDNSDVVGASPVGAAPTTSSSST